MQRRKASFMLAFVSLVCLGVGAFEGDTLGIAAGVMIGIAGAIYYLRINRANQRIDEINGMITWL